MARDVLSVAFDERAAREDNDVDEGRMDGAARHLSPVIRCDGRHLRAPLGLADCVGPKHPEIQRDAVMCRNSNALRVIHVDRIEAGFCQALGGNGNRVAPLARAGNTWWQEPGYDTQYKTATRRDVILSYPQL